LGADGLTVLRLPSTLLGHAECPLAGNLIGLARLMQVIPL